MLPRLTDALDFHSRALELRAERQRLIAGNIANADTPGYQARDFDFAALGAAAGSEGGGIAGDVMAKAAGSRTAMPVLRYALPTPTQLDGNTVDMDRKRGAFVDNAVKYESTLPFINASVKTTLDAMKSYHGS